MWNHIWAWDGSWGMGWGWFGLMHLFRWAILIVGLVAAFRWAGARAIAHQSAAGDPA